MGGTRWSTRVAARLAFGLGALARAVDQEGVDQRQVGQGGVGAARRRDALRSCRAATPGCRACRRGSSRARRRSGSLVRPASGRRPGSGVRAADPGRGRSPPACPRNPRGGWTISATIARPQHRQDDLPGRVPRCRKRGAVDKQVAGRWRPSGRSDRRTQVRGQARGEPGGMRRGGGDPDRVARQLSIRQPVRVPPGRPRSARATSVSPSRAAKPGNASGPSIPGPRRTPPRATAAAGRPRWPGCPGRPRCRSGNASWDRRTAPSRCACPRARRAAVARAADGDPGHPGTALRVGHCRPDRPSASVSLNENGSR